MLLPDYDCGTCKAGQKLRRGCEQDATEPLVLDGEDLPRCPRRPILEDPALWSELIAAWDDYQEGILPEVGAGQDQPARYMEIIRVFRQARRKAEEIDRKQAERDKNTYIPGPGRRGSR